MRFKHEQIKQLEHPYQKLKTADSLAEHSEELDKLSSKEMKDLAVKMVLACPPHEMKDFGYALNGLKTPDSQFRPVIYQAYETKKRILALSDPRNTKPHLLMIGTEVESSLFNEFNELALELLKNNEVSIATKLAISTPTEQRKELSRNMHNFFPQSEFATKVGAAFTLRREIDLYLLGDNPQDFFTSKEFNPGLCHEFAQLFSLLKGREQAIGEKLAKLEHPVKSEISRQLELLNPKAHDQQNPLRLIASAMVPQTEPQQTTEAVKKDATNLHRQFSPSLRERKKFPENLVLTKTDSGSESEDEEDDCSFNFCGLFK